MHVNYCCNALHLRYLREPTSLISNKTLFAISIHNISMYLFHFFFVSFHLRNQYKKAALIGTDTFSDLLQNACNFIKIALRHGCSVKNFTTFSVHIVSKSFERVLLTKWWEINPTISQNFKTLSPNFSYVILQYPLQKQIINEYD